MIKWQLECARDSEDVVHPFHHHTCVLMLINIPQVLFNDIYDTHEVFASKSEMLYYSVTDLKKNDLVLLKTKLTKYHVQGTDKTK